MMRGGNRNMRRMMDKMGLDMSEIPNLQEVIIKTDKKEIIIAKPSVTEMKAKDNTIFQVIAESYEEKETGARSGADAPPAPSCPPGGRTPAGSSGRGRRCGGTPPTPRRVPRVDWPPRQPVLCKALLGGGPGEQLIDHVDERVSRQGDEGGLTCVEDAERSGRWKLKNIRKVQTQTKE